MITVTMTNRWRYVLLAVVLPLLALVVTVRGVGAAGRPLSNLEVVEVSSDINTDTAKFATADCPRGKVATGGGYVIVLGGGDPTQIHVYHNAPNGFIGSKPVSWAAEAWGIVAVAHCASEGL